MTVTVNDSKKYRFHLCDAIKKTVFFVAVTLPLLCAHDASARRRLLPEAPSVEIHYEALIGLQRPASSTQGKTSPALDPTTRSTWQKGPEGIVVGNSPQPSTQKVATSASPIPTKVKAGKTVGSSTQHAAPVDLIVAPLKSKEATAKQVAKLPLSQPKLPLSKKPDAEKNSVAKSLLAHSEQAKEQSIVQKPAVKPDVTPVAKVADGATRKPLTIEVDKSRELPLKTMDSAVISASEHEPPSLASIPPTPSLLLKTKRPTQEEFLAGVDKRSSPRVNTIETKKDLPIHGAETLPSLPLAKSKFSLSETTLSLPQLQKTDQKQVDKIHPTKKDGTLSLPTPEKVVIKKDVSSSKLAPINEHVREGQQRHPINLPPLLPKSALLANKNVSLKNDGKITHGGNSDADHATTSNDQVALEKKATAIDTTKNSTLPLLPPTFKPSLPNLNAPSQPVESDLGGKAVTSKGPVKDALLPALSSLKTPEELKLDDENLKLKHDQQILEGIQKEPAHAVTSKPNFLSGLARITKDLISRKRHEDEAHASQGGGDKKTNEAVKPPLPSAKMGSKPLTLVPVPQSSPEPVLVNEDKPSSAMLPLPAANAIVLPPIAGTDKKHAATSPKTKKVEIKEELPALDMLNKHSKTTSMDADIAQLNTTDKKSIPLVKLATLPEKPPFGVMVKPDSRSLKPVAAPVTAVEVSNDLPPLASPSLLKKVVSNKSELAAISTLKQANDHRVNALGSLKFVKSVVKLGDEQRSLLASVAKNIANPVIVVAYAPEKSDNTNARHEALARALAVRGALIDNGVLSKMIRTEVKSSDIPKGLDNGVDIIPVVTKE